MAQNTPILGKIKSSESAASLDAKYGPYASKAAANAALGENGDDVITAGLTVGVTQSDGSVKEFWYQPDGQEVLQLVEKQTASVKVDSALSSTSENPVQNKVVKSALDAKGTYSKPSGGIPKADLASGVQTSLDKADTALQHSDNYVKAGNSSGESSVTDFDPYNDTVHNSAQALSPTQQAQVRQNIKAQEKIASMTATSLPYGSSPTVNMSNGVLQLGIPGGADAVNPFKGWWPDLATLKAAHTATAGDSAYVKDASPATTWSIYVYDSTASSNNYWADSGLDADTSHAQTFASGEEVNETYIDDTHLANPMSGALPTAADVMKLKAKLEGVTASDVKVSYTAISGWKVAADGTLSSNENAKYTTIPLNGAKTVRFLGLNISNSATTATKNTGYCFGHYNGEEIEDNWIIDYYAAYKATAESYIAEEYIVDAPSMSTHFRTNVKYSSLTEDTFYCYLQSGESVDDLIKKDSNNVVDASCPFERLWYMGATSFLPIYINSSGTKWISSTTVKSFITAISNVKYMKLTTGEYVSRIAFLKNNLYVAGEAPSYCDGTKLLSFGANTTVILNVPDDCNYLYVYAGTSSTDPAYQSLPSSIERCNNNEVATELKAIKSDVFDFMKESVIDLEKNRSLGYIVTIVRTTTPYIGRWYQAQRHYEVAIPEDSKYVKIVGNETISTAYSFFTEHTVYPVQANSIPPYVDGVDQAFVIEANETVVSKIPEGAKWLYIRAGSSEDNLDRKPQYAAFLNTTEEKDPYDILELNPDTEIYPKMLALQKGSGGPSSTGGIKPNTFIFGHITDCHGGENAGEGSVSNRTWKRFLKFSNHWKEKGFIDDIVDTGDMVGNVFSNSIAWRTNADDVLNVIGNHDTATVSNKVYNWTAKAGKDAYDKFVSPYIENWGVVQPDNADTEGYCYYYKDYERTSNGNTIKLRCIFVDVMGWDDNNVQKSWLDNVLEDARVNGFVVCIFTHFVPVRTRPLKCAFTSKTLGVSTEDFPYHGFNTYCKQLCACVRTFQDNGGIFACYVAGHRHILGIAQVYGNVTIDGTSFDFDDESKPQIVVYGTAGYVNLGNLNDYFREANTKNEDNFQIVAIDTFKGINDDIASSSFRIKVLKIGCNYNRHMQLADVVDVTYYPYQPFDAANQNYTIGTIVNKDNVLYRIIKPVYTNGLLDWENSVIELASRIVNE